MFAVQAPGTGHRGSQQSWRARCSNATNCASGTALSSWWIETASAPGWSTARQPSRAEMPVTGFHSGSSCHGIAPPPRAGLGARPPPGPRFRPTLQRPEERTNCLSSHRRRHVTRHLHRARRLPGRRGSRSFHRLGHEKTRRFRGKTGSLWCPNRLHETRSLRPISRRPGKTSFRLTARASWLRRVLRAGARRPSPDRARGVPAPGHASRQGQRSHRQDHRRGAPRRAGRGRRAGRTRPRRRAARNSGAGRGARVVRGWPGTCRRSAGDPLQAARG